MTVSSKMMVETQQVISNEDKKRLSEFLFKRLIECGWEDELELVYQQIMEENEHTPITNDELIHELNTRAPIVPEEVKLEVLGKIVEYRGGSPYILNTCNMQKGLQMAFSSVELDLQGTLEVYIRVTVNVVEQEN